MLTLALETSTPLGSVAIGEGTKLLAECTLSVRATHSETVLDEVDRLLARAGVGPEDLEAVAVGAGPGSFTGVRIAAALAKGLCYARDVPLFAFSSLRVLAASVGNDGPLCAVFDARRDEVYAAAFREGADRPAALEPSVLPVDRLLERLAPVDEWTFAGEGALRHAGIIGTRKGVVLPAHLGVPRAAALLWLAEVVPDGLVEDRTRWEPTYVRASGAERGIGSHG